MGSSGFSWSYGVGFVAMAMIQSAGDGWGFALGGIRNTHETRRM